MTSPQRLRVLISGGGIAGTCLAYWLSRTKLRPLVTILERSPVPRTTGQAVDVRGPAIDVVRQMSIIDKLKARHTTELGTEFINGNGRPFARFSGSGGKSFTGEFEILRADLAKTFTELTEQSSTVNFRYGDSIKSLSQTSKEVQVDLASGSTETFDLLVAADGSTSRTRQMILPQSVLRNSYRLLGQYIAFFSIPRQADDERIWKWYTADRGRALMTRPHRNPETIGAYACVTLPHRDTSDVAFENAISKGIDPQKRFLQKHLESMGWQSARILKAMNESKDFYMSRAALVKLPKWTNGRCTVLGDAAHATFGSGTSLAIQGAYMLAGELSSVQHSDEIPAALERFEQKFRPMVEKDGDIPAVFPQWASPQTKWGLLIRNSLLWIVSHTRIYRLFMGGRFDETIDSKMPIYDWTDK